MRRIALAALLILITACGEQTVAERTPTTATTEPTPTSRNITTEGIRDKRVGQPGGFGCGDGPDAACDVLFTVTAIELNPSCPGVTPPAGHRLLRIEVDAQASPTFQYAVPRTALMLVHWAIETGNGDLERDLHAVDACSPHPGLFAAQIEPGSHPRDSVVVLAPSRATWLWLEYEGTAAYRWPVRPPV